MDGASNVFIKADCKRLMEVRVQTLEQTLECDIGLGPATLVGHSQYANEAVNQWNGALWLDSGPVLLVYPYWLQL